MPAKSISFASTTVSRASAKSETTIAFGPVVSLSPSFASTTSAKPGTTTRIYNKLIIPKIYEVMDDHILRMGVPQEDMVFKGGGFCSVEYEVRHA
ncbi:hypothetical protein BGX29_006555 [Mortierella sp. GBA35]|nr:hypothetical protein BGX29_006555 [Mortierella sp. GBA35]